MNNKITTTYHGTEIAYNEQANRWLFIARGRERSSESLALAKAAIDKPEPTEKKPFARRQAWLVNYSNTPSKVTVTAVAESRGIGTHYWIKDGVSKLKAVGYQLFEDNDTNATLFATILALEKERSEINKRIEKAEDGLVKFKE